MIPNFGDPSGQRHVGGRRRDTHTADKVLTHDQTLLFYRYTDRFTNEFPGRETEYCSFTIFWCVKISVTSDRGAAGSVQVPVSLDAAMIT